MEEDEDIQLTQSNSQALLEEYTERYLNYLSQEKVRTSDIPMHVSLSDIGIKLQIDTDKIDIYPGLFWNPSYTFNPYLKFKNLMAIYYRSEVKVSNQIFTAFYTKNMDYLLGFGFEDILGDSRPIVTLGVNYFVRRLLVDKYYLGITMSDGKNLLVEVGFVNAWGKLFN
jgi:hypothetical protein